MKRILERFYGEQITDMEAAMTWLALAGWALLVLFGDR